MRAAAEKEAAAQAAAIEAASPLQAYYSYPSGEIYKSTLSTFLESTT